MNETILSRFLSFVVISCLVVAPIVSAQEKQLFNGNDLSGWDGNPELWSVQNGVITGTTKDDAPLPYNQFLIWRGGKLKNFELRVTARQSGNNSGIQYRSKELSEVGKWSMAGYQCDIHPAPANNAMLYDERGRGIVAANGEEVIVDPAGKKWVVKSSAPINVNVADWNEYKIIARGNRFIHQVNGKTTVDIVDHQAAERELEGLLAFQVHRGPAMKIEIKEVFLKELSDGDVLTPEQYPIPKDAKEKAGPAPRKNAPKVSNDSKKKEKSNLSQVALSATTGNQDATKTPANNEAKPAAQAPAKSRPARQSQVGPVVNENKATPIDRIKVAKDFQIELLYSVPGGDQGSWVNLCLDNKGRILASDQYGGLFRFAAPALGKPLDPAKVEKMPVDIRAVNGMVWAFDALYVGVNDYEKKIPSGLYRISDSNNDDELDKVELLRGITANGDHGVHAVVPTPDGKGLYLVCGNGAKLTQPASSSQVPAIWGEDHLLPRMPDGRGFMRDVLAPGGIIYRVTPDGKNFEVFSSGYRNIFDASLNADGELFTYDADMEYDFNTSWYRPTRVNHVVSGSEYGWRNGAGKRPEFYADNLPATINIGPGSPTGTTFGYGAKFPAKYQKALFILDWSWGKLYAVHLEPNGSSYVATKEDFISGLPLPLTDAIINPADGAMYFTIGGRRVQSGLYRVTYTGTEPTTQIEKKANSKGAAERNLRLSLEAFHGKQDGAAINQAWPHLKHSDRFVRWAARTAIEHQPLMTWLPKALSESDPAIQIEALLAGSRLGGVCPQHRTEKTPVADPAVGAKILSALEKIDWLSLSPELQLSYVRTVEIAFNRFGRPEKTSNTRWISKLDQGFPAKSFPLNWLLCETLVFLESPTVAAKGMALIENAPSQEAQIEYARSLRMLKTGWSMKTRTAYLEWLLKAANYRGGASFEKFIEFIRKDALLTLSDSEKLELKDLLEKKPVPKSTIENVGAIFAGRKENSYQFEDVSKMAIQELEKNGSLVEGIRARNLENGRKMFGAAACFTCHRFDNQGGMNGPDLTSAGRRYSVRDLVEQIMVPSKEINEQFVPIDVITEDDERFRGVVVNLNGDTITLNTDPSNPDERKTIDRKTVTSIAPSKISPMPLHLIDMMSKDEILDLLAYVLNGGIGE
jgi:putative heme-binding domain-containing protein